MSEDQTLNLSDFAKVIDFNSLYQSYTEARKGKRWKYAVCKYEVNVLENLMFVHFMLSAHKYRLSPYNCFIVKEPKERLIMYNSFRDKIVQHSLCDNVLEPYLSKTFIYDNYASQKGKGTHFGLDRLKAVHLNDSKFGFESHKDRHEKIGLGHIGEKAFERIINHPALRNCVFCLETPNELDGYAKEIALLRSLRKD